MTTTENTIEVNGIELGYRTLGEGDPLIMLPGSFGSSEMFGRNVELLARQRTVIAVDLQSHGRSPASDRPMTYEAMADDVAALIHELGLGQAAILGFSLGGAVALRTGIQHGELVERLILVSTVVRRRGWHPEMVAALDAMGPETAAYLRHTPLYQTYQQVAPDVTRWDDLVRQATGLGKVDYDWRSEIDALSMPVMLVVGDADGLPPSHAVEFFSLLGGGLRDASWDGSGMTRHQLAILPKTTHYDINTNPTLASVVAPFLSDT